MNTYAQTHNDAQTALTKCRVSTAYHLQLCAISQCDDPALCLLMLVFAADMAVALQRYNDALLLCATVAAMTDEPPKPKRTRRGTIKPVLSKWQLETEYARKEAE